MTEELTAEEREWLLRAGRRENKLLRLYDAALARAEAAETELAVVRRRGTPSGHVVALEAELQTEKRDGAEWKRLAWERAGLHLAAESALGEATALLERCRDVEALRVLKDYFEARCSEPTGCNQVPPELAFTPDRSQQGRWGVSGKQCDECGCTHGPGNTNSMCQLASNYRQPPAAPEMPEGSRWEPCAAGFSDGRVLLVMCAGGLAIATKRPLAAGVHLTELSMGELRALLATQGLTIVPAASVPVLQACEKLVISTDAIGPISANGKPQICSSTMAVAAAEWARRGQPSGAAIDTDLQGLDPHTT